MRALVVVLFSASATVSLLLISAQHSGVAVARVAPAHDELAAHVAAVAAPDDRPYPARAFITSEVAQNETTDPLVASAGDLEPTVATAVAAPAPAPRAQPSPALVVAPVATAPTECPAGWFCYPRLGIRGAIVPYSDCTGSTDVGTAIRRFTCVGGTYILAHAYTQFGKITGFAIGDKVIADGRTYTIYDSFTQQSCAAPARPPAVLSMQTSLSSTACGPVLVVQAR